MGKYIIKKKTIYYCHFCGEIFKRKSQLKNHLDYGCIENPEDKECSTCDYQSQEPGQLHYWSNGESSYYRGWRENYCNYFKTRISSKNDCPHHECEIFMEFFREVTWEYKDQTEMKKIYGFQKSQKKG